MVRLFMLLSFMLQVQLQIRMKLTVLILLLKRIPLINDNNRKSSSDCNGKFFALRVTPPAHHKPDFSEEDASA